MYLLNNIKYFYHLYGNRNIDYDDKIKMNFRCVIGYQIISILYLYNNISSLDFIKNHNIITNFIIFVLQLWTFTHSFFECFDLDNNHNLSYWINSNLFNLIFNLYFKCYSLVTISLFNIFGKHTKSTYLSVLSSEAIIRILYLKNSFNFIDYCMCWLIMHFIILFLVENILYQYHNSNFWLKSHEISLFLLGIIHPLTVIGIIKNDLHRVFEINSPIDVYHNPTAISAKIFVGYLLRDCINGLIYSERYRNRFKYNITNWIHHLFFIMITVTDIKLEIYSHDYVYLILAEISTIFLYLKEATNFLIFKRLFLITFFIFRIVFYIIGFFLTIIRLYNNFPDIHLFFICLTPLGTIFGLLLNSFWFLKMIKK